MELKELQHYEQLADQYVSRHGAAKDEKEEITAAFCSGFLAARALLIEIAKEIARHEKEPAQSDELELAPERLDPIKSLIGDEAFRELEEWFKRGEEERQAKTEQHLFEIEQHLSSPDFSYAKLHDSLTGLPNRSFLFERINFALEKSKADKQAIFCILFIDLDRFKNVNDSFGYESGDYVLKIIGKRLEEILRPGDTVARLGGNEFAILLASVTHETEAIDFAEKIYQTIAEPITLNSKVIKITGSIGITMSNKKAGQRPEDLLRDADIAMYYAKKNATKWSVYDEELRLKLIETVRLEKALRKQT